MKPCLFGPCLSFSDSFSSLKSLRSQVTVHLDLLVTPTWDVLNLFAFAHVALLPSVSAHLFSLISSEQVLIFKTQLLTVL